MVIKKVYKSIKLGKSLKANIPQGGRNIQTPPPSRGLGQILHTEIFALLSVAQKLLVNLSS